MVVILIILLIWWLLTGGSEHLGNPWFLDQFSMASSDPVWMNYLGYERDVLGQSPRDYYLENQINSQSGVGPQYFENDTAFMNHDDYKSMPIRYRPLRQPSATKLQIQSEIKSNDMEENLYDDLNRVGNY